MPTLKIAHPQSPSTPPANESAASITLPYSPALYKMNLIVKGIATSVVGSFDCGDGVASLFVEDTCRAIVCRRLSSCTAKHLTSQAVSITLLLISRAMWCLMNSLRIGYSSPGQVVHHTRDWSKLNRVVGWNPLGTWSEDLKQTIAWYEANRDAWWRQFFIRHTPIITASGKMVYHRCRLVRLSL
jgi:hypothetical protein